MKFSFAAIFAAATACLVAAAPSHPIAQRATPLAKVYSSCTKNNTVALTFDDGPYVYMYDISKALVAAGAKGTFFVNGNNYECIYDDNGKRVKYLYDKGHQLEALMKITGAYPAFMRPPYGNYNDLVRQASYIRGQALAIWDFDSGDSIGATWQQSEADYAALVAKKPKNILPLNHETIETTAHKVVPYVINLLQSKGYKLVTLAGFFGTY
ncbi:Carbohydrate esterase 4 protein [Tulasnella sp. 424]|nr:Carbohydrate esterase 4 protein [Tulasnella sp. 424]